MASSTVNFSPATKFAVGIGPNSVTSGDFNGDGILDLVTANGSNTVSVLLGNGKGSFGTATNFAAGNAPNTITARDFNSDGILDLVTANLLSNNVSVLLGDGKGSFGTPTQFDVGYFPNSVTAGDFKDFNGDGILDLVTADPYNNNLSVLLGDGKGSFGTPSKFAVLNNPNFVAVGDFNGDGIADLATTNYTLGKSTVSVLLGNGKGNFGTPTSFEVGVHPDVDGHPILLTIGDFNGDGISDLATANYGSIDVSVLLGNGKGSFAAATNFAVAGSPTSVTVGDFNNDGISDLATANAAYSISVLQGDGKGNFATATKFSGYYTPTSATVGDFNGDGLSDLAIADSDGNNVSILLNQNVAIPVVTAPVVTPPVVVTAPPVVIEPVVIPPVVITAPPVNASPAVTPTIASSFIPGITVAKNLFTTDATIKGFGISAVSQKATNKVNEIGVFAVDDASGKIGSIEPGTLEYLKAALNIAKPIFTSLAGDFLSKVNQEFSIDPNKTYQFFEIQDGSLVDAKQQIASGKTPNNLLFSLPDASGNSPIKVTNNSNNDGYQISVNADELVLNVVKLAAANVNSPIGTKSQTAPEGRTIDLTDYAGQTLKADITTTSSAAYTNNVGFYAVEDSIGSIKLADGSFVKPGDTNYAVEAIKSALTNSLQAGKTDSKIDQNIAGGRIYAPVVVTQGTFADFASKNPTNSGGVNNVHAYFNYIGANSDNIDHFRLIGNNKFGVEDMYGGGDRDFNDLVVSMNIKA